MIKTLIVMCIVFFSSKGAFAWQLQNLSDEPRVFNEYHKGQYTPHKKTADPRGGWLSFTNQKDITVVDQKTGQQIHNPGFKMMVIRKDGSVQFR